MSTFDKLQAILASPVVNHGGYMYKAPIKSTTCVDGVTASIQASETHYCFPRENVGPYTAVEIWCIKGTDTTTITQFEYDSEEPSGYVPIEAIVAFLDAHGGIAD